MSYGLVNSDPYQFIFTFQWFPLLFVAACTVSFNAGNALAADEVLTGEQWVLEASEEQQWISNQTNNDP